ncbi:MAG: PhoH family protein, partial [Nocardioides sp.]|nr:PhoH family protein [Nocardioides sp.]
QVDLPSGTKSGLRVVEGILDGVEDIAFCRLTPTDVVRHRLVGRIVEAYEVFDASPAQTAAADRPRGTR